MEGTGSLEGPSDKVRYEQTPREVPGEQCFWQMEEQVQGVRQKHAPHDEVRLPGWPRGECAQS